LWSIVAGLDGRSPEELKERLLDIEALEARWDCTKSVIYGMRYRGDGPPALRIGRELRWRLADVEAWEQARIEDA
jgi:predicted DNA-binding transcriptional regulator AlpA